MGIERKLLYLKRTSLKTLQCLYRGQALTFDKRKKRTVNANVF